MACTSGVANAEAKPDYDHIMWASLPPNVMVRIMLKLSLQDLCHCSSVCRSWQLAAEADRLWQALLCNRYSCAAPTQYATSCKQSMMQLKTGTLWTCGSPWPRLTASVAGAPASSRATELVKLWSNIGQTTALPLQRYCALPADFAVTAVAAGENHLVLLSSSGYVTATRVDTATLTAVMPLAGLLAFAGATAVAVAPEAAAVDAAQAQALPGGVLTATGAGALPAVAAADELPQAPFQAVWMDNNGENAGMLGEGLQEAFPLEQDQQQPQSHQQQQMLGVLQMANLWRPFGARVSSIAAGTGHVLAVTECGQVWGWGSNECGQLGLGHVQQWVAVPAEITAALDGAWKADGDVIAAAACGALHSALLAASGAVYTAGCNKQGQCGQEQGMLLCTVFCQPTQAENASPVAAAAVACGLSNTAIATTQGRLLVCGDAASGQCGALYVKQRACYQFVDCGPQLGWHGLNRPTAAQVAAAGGDVAGALPKIVSVAAGCNTCYAVTNEGEVYAWGAGSKGQLGSGGSPKVQATPAKLPWAKRITQISASLHGQFAAAVDASGHLYTWGAGKWGQLGHGDTSKRTVGRAVKQLRHTEILQAVCGSESLLCLTCSRPSQQHAHSAAATAKSREATGHATHPNARDNVRLLSHRPFLQSHVSAIGSHSGSGGWRPSIAAEAAADEVQEEGEAAAAALGDMSMEGVAWVDIEGRGPFYCPAPRSGRKGSWSARRLAAADSPQGSNELQYDIGGTTDSSIHLTPSGSSSSSSNNSCAQQQQQQQRLQGRCSRIDTRGGRTPAAAAASATAAVELHLDKGITTGQQDDSATECSGNEIIETGSDGLPQPRRHPHMDKGFRRLLKRLLKNFVADNRQRELEFPATLSSSDRYYIHVAAEAWGLGHASHNDGEERVIKVWKVSRSRRMRSGPDPQFDSD